MIMLVCLRLIAFRFLNPFSQKNWGACRFAETLQQYFPGQTRVRRRVHLPSIQTIGFNFFAVAWHGSSRWLPSLFLLYELQARRILIVTHESKMTCVSPFFLVQCGCRTRKTSHLQKVGKPDGLDSLEGDVVFWND